MRAKYTGPMERPGSTPGIAHCFAEGAVHMLPIPKWKIDRIRQLVSDGVPYSAIGERVGLTPRSIYRLVQEHQISGPPQKSYLAFGT